MGAGERRDVTSGGQVRLVDGGLQTDPSGIRRVDMRLTVCGCRLVGL